MMSFFTWRLCALRSSVWVAINESVLHHLNEGGLSECEDVKQFGAEKCWTGHQKTHTRTHTHIPRQPAESGDIWNQLLNVKTTSCCCLYNQAVSEWKHVRARREGPDKISPLWSLSKSWQLITQSLQNKLISAPQLVMHGQVFFFFFFTQRRRPTYIQTRILIFKTWARNKGQVVGDRKGQSNSGRLAGWRSPPPLWRLGQQITGAA